MLAYARETIRDESGTRFRQRVRWWSLLALLRSLASSPVAAAETLRNRAAAASADSVEEADLIGRHSVMDLLDDESAESADVAPGADPTLEDEGRPSRERRRLLEMAREAEGLQGAKDEKLQKAVGLVAELVKDGYQPIVFCRFIPTAGYVAEALRAKLPKGVEVAAVTGLLPPAERETRVLQLAQAERRVLVATDCLSEGINLQDHFDAVVHYDLSWNPTRHEQRERRVDRYGQPSPKVRVVTYYGVDNQIDGVVLQVLLRKHRQIRHSLGISVPVPLDSDQVIEAIFEGLLLRGQPRGEQQALPLFEDLVRPQTEDFYRRWEGAAEREKRSRTLFSQESISGHLDAVRREWDAARAAVGAGADVAAFTRQALAAHGATVGGRDPLAIDLAEAPRALREVLGPAVGDRTRFQARFELPVPDDVEYLERTHPFVEGLATYVMDTALDAAAGGVARRCGAIRTGAVACRTTLLLVRCRYHIVTQRPPHPQPPRRSQYSAPRPQGARGSGAALERCASCWRRSA